MCDQAVFPAQTPSAEAAGNADLIQNGKQLVVMAREERVLIGRRLASVWGEDVGEENFRHCRDTAPLFDFRKFCVMHLQRSAKPLHLLRRFVLR